MRKTALIIALLLLTPVIGLELNSASYNKGDKIIITASSLTIGQTYDIIATLKEKTVFTHRFTALNNSYEYTYNSSFLDPSGIWIINMNDESINTTINPTRDSSTLLVTYLSPVSRSYERTSKFNIEVNLTSGSEIVTSASLQTYNQNGERVNLTEKGEGVYLIPYELLLDSLTGTRTITVTALKEGVGGEGRINITVTKATIDLLIQQPELNNYDVGSKMNIKILATYPNGTVINTPLTASYNNKEVILELIDGLFTGSYELRPEDEGLATLTISVEDEFGNTGLVSKKITASSLILYYIRSNLLLIIAGIVGFSLLIFFTRKKVVSSNTHKELKRKMKEVIDNKKRLQEDYYVNKTIDKPSYEEEISKIDEELNIIKGKIKHFETKLKKKVDKKPAKKK